MDALNVLYIRMLHLGFVVLTQAFRSNDREWVQAEIELLHNVPSLIDEANLERHRYFWFSEREQYIEWVTGTGRTEQASRMRTYYEPIWTEMEPIILKKLRGSASPGLKAPA